MQKILFVFLLIIAGTAFFLFQYWQHLEEPVMCNGAEQQCSFGTSCYPLQTTVQDPLPGGVCRPWLESFFSE